MSLQKGLIGHWTMDDDELNDSSPYDTQGNKRNGTEQIVEGQVDNAIHMGDGEGITLDNSDHFELMDDSFTIAFWMKPEMGADSSLFHTLITHNSFSRIIPRMESSNELMIRLDFDDGTRT